MEEKNQEQNALEASEIARNQAEKIKLIREADEIALRTKHQSVLWLFMKYGGAALVAGGLFTTWGIGYLKPMLEKKQESYLLENQILSHRNELAKQENQAQRKQNNIVAENNNRLKEDLETELRRQKQQNSELIIKNEELSCQIEILSLNIKNMHLQSVRQTGEKETSKPQKDSIEKEIKNLTLLLKKAEATNQELKTNLYKSNDLVLSKLLASTRWSLTPIHNRFTNLNRAIAADGTLTANPGSASLYDFLNWPKQITLDDKQELIWHVESSKFVFTYMNQKYYSSEIVNAPISVGSELKIYTDFDSEYGDATLKFVMTKL